MNLNSINAFDLKICPLPIGKLVEQIDRSIGKRSTPIIISGINAHAVVSSTKDNKYLDYLQRSTIVNIDGYSVVFALRLLGYSIKERAACPDLFHSLLSLAEKKHYSVYFWGAQKQVVDEAAKKLQAKYPALNIAGVEPGYFCKDTERKIIKDIQSKKPTMLFLGMSSPQKEDFAFKHFKKNTGVILGVGGVFDIEAGKIKRAPKYIQSIGMEWFFRFLQEPKRMWRRYLIGNIHFGILVVKEKFRKKDIFDTKSNTSDIKAITFRRLKASEGIKI